MTLILALKRAETIYYVGDTAISEWISIRGMPPIFENISDNSIKIHQSSTQPTVVYAYRGWTDIYNEHHFEQTIARNPFNYKTKTAQVISSIIAQQENEPPSSRINLTYIIGETSRTKAQLLTNSVHTNGAWAEQTHHAIGRGAYAHTQVELGRIASTATTGEIIPQMRELLAQTKTYERRVEQNPVLFGEFIGIQHQDMLKTEMTSCALTEYHRWRK